MKANRIVTFILSNFLVISAFAQIQQGYVKSLGRPDKKGVALSGVSVRVKGEHNVVLSQQDGTLSMLLTGKKNGDVYSLQQVQKTGYELNEKAVVGRQYAFSDKVPLVIVMVSKEQLQADKQRIEDNAYQVAEKKYKAKLAQLEKQKEKSAISIENYQAELQDLQDKFEKYQSLIEGLAEHYAHVDYDNLTEKEREINICIENGDLERADLLIQKLFNPIDVIKRSKEALATIEQQETQARSILTQANADMVAVMKQQDKDAEYLYQLYTIAAGQFDYEKARFYIETRAELDTTNVEWQHDAAYYYFNQKQYRKAEVYYKRALVLYQQFVESAPDTYEPYVAITLNSLGTILYENHWMAEAEKMYLSALETCQHLATSNPEVSESIVPIVQNNLANLYMDTQRYLEAEKMILEVLEANKRYAVSNPETYEPKVAMTQLNLANLYKDTQRLAEAEKMYLSALEALKRLASSDPKANEPYLAVVEGSLGILYFMTQRYAEAEKLFLASLEIDQRLAAANPEAYEPNLAATQNKLAILYYGTLRYAEAEKEYLSALEIYQRLALAHPEVYKQDVAGTQEKLALLYSETEQFDKAEKMYLSVLEIRQRLAKDNPEVYEPRLARTQNDLVILYHKTQRLAEAESMCLSALKSYQHLAASDPKTYELEVATTQNTLAVLYYMTKRNAKAFHAFYEALVVYERLAKSNQSQQENYDNTLSVLKVLYSIFELSGEIPKECEADVEKIKGLLEKP